MSLDVYLTEDITDFAVAADLCEDNGFLSAAQSLRDLANTPKEFYSANITHNLTKMASEAGIYEACWRPEENNITEAKQLIPLLESGLEKLKTKPNYFKQFNSPNGWGTYENFVSWVEKYLAACKEYPEAQVTVSR